MKENIGGPSYTGTPRGKLEELFHGKKRVKRIKILILPKHGTGIYLV